MKKPPADGPRSSDEKATAPNSRERQLAEAVADFVDLQAREESMDAGSFCRQHPELEPDLRDALQILDGIDSLLSPAAPSPSRERAVEALPEKLSGHKIIGLIGTGGMGRVLLASDEGLGRKVAIKTLGSRYLHDDLLRTRFMQEARAMARLSHPNIVRIYSLGQPDEIPHFVMEYVQGVPLVEAIRTLTLEQKIELMIKVVMAVEFLHQNRIIHRDLKPGNILVGSDLEPKLLDFGLAQQVGEEGNRITRAGEIMGTPDYFSPEQAQADPSLGARSDIFSLGAIFYELLTGVVPFRSTGLAEQLRQICESDPVLPRRLNADIPGAIQNICLKALEKRPSDRYSTAGEMARDLERYLAGEAVLANPTTYSRIMAGKVEQHMRELDGWQQDRILSWYEFDAFRRLYDRLAEREDAWILEARRLSISQVTLYLGAWVSVLAAALLLFFRYPGLSGMPSVILVAGTTAPTAWIGLRCWKLDQKRIAVAYLLAFCLLLPTTLLIAMKEWRLLTHFSQGKESLEFFAKFETFRVPAPQTVIDKEGTPVVKSVSVFKGPTNAQIWWALVLALPAYLWLRRFTRASVFSLVFSVITAMLCIVSLLRLGMLDWLADDPGKVYFRMIPFAILFFAGGSWLENRRCTGDSRYFYPIAVLFTFVALSGVAGFHKPYSDWLQRVWPWTRGQIEYLFIINAGVYLALQSASEHFGSPQMRTVAKSFRFVIPGHVLTSLLLLGLAASSRWEKSLERLDFRYEARIFEILLPIAACLFVFGSVPKQMKNFFVTGLIFLAVGIGRLQQDVLKERPAWPITLLAVGFMLMVIAANYTPVRLAAGRLFRRKH